MAAFQFGILLLTAPGCQNVPDYFLINGINFMQIHPSEWTEQHPTRAGILSRYFLPPEYLKIHRVHHNCSLNTASKLHSLIHEWGSRFHSNLCCSRHEGVPHTARGLHAAQGEFERAQHKVVNLLNTL